MVIFVALTCLAVRRYCYHVIPRILKLLHDIALHCLQSASRRTCSHMMQASFHIKIGRLEKAGLPRLVINAIAESLQRKTKISTQKST